MAPGTNGGDKHVDLGPSSGLPQNLVNIMESATELQCYISMDRMASGPNGRGKHVDLRPSIGRPQNLVNIMESATKLQCYISMDRKASGLTRGDTWRHVLRKTITVRAVSG
jgi:hypothetical protein